MIRTLTLLAAGVCLAMAQTATEPNLALGKPAIGSTSCNPDESPAQAVNGSTTGGNGDKWCSAQDSKWLQVDLGANYLVNRVIVRHAGAGDESPDYNTRAFKIHVSTDGKNYSMVANVADNDLDVSTHTFAPTAARYVQLEVLIPTQNGDGAARIYEFEVYGKRQ